MTFGLISAIAIIIRRWWVSHSLIIRRDVRTNVSAAAIAQFDGIFIENLGHLMTFWKMAFQYFEKFFT